MPDIPTEETDCGSSWLLDLRLGGIVFAGAFLVILLILWILFS